MLTENDLNNHRVIKVECKPWTNHNSARIVLTETYLDKRHRYVLSWTHAETDNARKHATNYLRSIGINCVAFGTYAGHVYIMSDSWAYDKPFITIKGETL